MNQHQSLTPPTLADETVQAMADIADVQDLAPELDVKGGQNNLKQFGIARATQGNNLKQLGLAGG